MVARRCPSVTSRTHPNPSARPFIPLALFSFFDGVIGLPQCSHLISQHLAHSREHVRAAAQEFTRADGTLKFSYTRLTTEIVNCCSSYKLPQPSPGGLPPIVGPLPAQGPSGNMPAPALNVRPRLPAESRSRTPPGPPGTSLFDYDADFTQSEPLPRAKERAKERAKVKAKANGKVKTHPLMPVPPTPHELKVRVQIKGKVKAKPSNPQHFLPPCPLGRPSRVVRSACTPFVIYRPSFQYTLWAVHLGPSGVPVTHTLIPLPYIPPLRHSPGRPFRAVRSAIAAHHPNYLNLSLHLATPQAVHLGPSGVFAIVPLPATLQNPPHLHSLEAVHLGPSWVTIIFTFTTLHISPNHTTSHISSLRAVHLGPSEVAIPVLPPFPFYPHSTPFPPLLQVVLGRPFRAVRSTINLISTPQTHPPP